MNTKGPKMAVKYHCRKCGKRFVDWGAEKLGYKCPDCEGEELIRVGSPDDKVVRRPSLKRKVRRPVVPLPVDEERGITGIDALPAEPVAEVPLYIAEDEGAEEEAELLDETEAVEEEAEDVESEPDIGFVEVTPPLAEDIEEVLPESEDAWPA
ncbi:MAG TPA: hypothetical protein VMZ06_18155 [Candidatus Bathyarchaeia archaeon]|nr:hypothetical protein [Candidatus Bathyarchaeia archaeon]